MKSSRKNTTVMTPAKRITRDKPEMTIQVVLLFSQLQLGDLQSSLEQIVDKTSPPVLTFLSHARFIGAVLKQNFTKRSLRSVSPWLQEVLLSFRKTFFSLKARSFYHCHGNVIFVFLFRCLVLLKALIPNIFYTLNRTKYLELRFMPITVNSRLQ